MQLYTSIMFKQIHLWSRSDLYDNDNYCNCCVHGFEWYNKVKLHTQDNDKSIGDFSFFFSFQLLQYYVPISDCLF